MRPRGFVELTTLGGDKILLHPDGIVVVCDAAKPDKVYTWVQTRIDGCDYAVGEPYGKVTAAIERAMRERGGDGE